VDKELEDQLQDKQVRCPADNCSFTAPLHIFLLHSHGRAKYSNANVDFGRIQAERSRFIPLPSLAALEADNVASGVMDMREQLQQASWFSVASLAQVVCLPVGYMFYLC